MLFSVKPWPEPSFDSIILSSKPDLLLNCMQFHKFLASVTVGYRDKVAILKYVNSIYVDASSRSKKDGIQWALGRCQRRISEGL